MTFEDTHRGIRDAGSLTELGIVIATYNRAELLRQCLDALAAQSEASSNFEVIVVVDGSTDGTAEFLASYTGLRNLHVHVQPNQGVGAARNKGAELSSARLLLFLDDDMVAAPDLVSTHIEAHRSSAGIVGLGHIVNTVPPDADCFNRSTSAGLSDHYDRLKRGRRPSFMDCYSGNLSVPRQAFVELGGFAPDLPRSEDVELGYRLQMAGLTLVYLESAIARQEYRKTFGEIGADAEKGGAAALMLYARHPAMLPYMHLSEFCAASLGFRVARTMLLALSPPSRLLQWLSALFDGSRRERGWYRLLYSYFYWRGVRRSTGDGDLWKRLTDGTRILMYHAVGTGSEPASRYVIPNSRLLRQMRWLKRRGYRVLTFREYLRLRRENELAPRKSVIVTFDDGYADFHDAGHPVLQQVDFPATMFVVSGAVGSSNKWDGSGALRERPTLSWQALDEMQRGSVECGAHSRSHVALTAISPARRREEIEGCLADLKDRLPSVLPVYSYPYGKWDEDVEAEIARAGFEGACTVMPGMNVANTPPFRLRRTEVYGTDNLLQFGFLLWSGHRMGWPARAAAS